MPKLTDIARATVARHDMLPGGCVVLAMVSGGADSVALLRLLAAREIGACAEVRVLHVNHGLRGDAADADEASVAALCASLGVACDVVHYDVAGYARGEGLNLEDAGRRVRYRFANSILDARCEALGASPECGRIAVAHTFDDRLETFLVRLVTGAGNGGLRSIAPVRGRVVRPLLDARRSDVVAHLDALGQTWREDVTNADTTRQRAWVRHELLPLIEERNPSFAATLSRTLGIISEEDALLAGMAGAFAHDFARIEGEALVFDRTLMCTLTRPMARRTVRNALLEAFPEASRLEFEHTDAIVEGMGDPTFARDLPDGLRVEAEYDTLRISREGIRDARLDPVVLPLPGSADRGPGGWLEAREVPVGEVACSADRAMVDADAVSWPLVVDSVRDGDRIRPLGMDGTKKVGDLLTDAKVPRRLRTLVPVVRDGDRVVWVAGVRLSDEVRVTRETTRMVELVWRGHEAGMTPLSDVSDEPKEGR